jgi:hypothetical protein
MRRAPLIIITVTLIVIALVALNAVSYFHESEQATDTEERPNRSTYNAGATGTRALFDLLSESGARVMRWREPPAALFTERGDIESGPRTFVVVGRKRLDFTDEEIYEFLSWVGAGGRLVVIDRTPDARLIPAGEPDDRWRIVTRQSDVLPHIINAQNQNSMVEGVSTSRPGQPSSLTLGVESIQPSRLASRLRLIRETGGITGETLETEDAQPPQQQHENASPDANTEDAPEAADARPRPSPERSAPLPPPPPAPISSPQIAREHQARAPITEFTDETGGALLIEYAYGNGRVILLSDPFIVTNSGIARADNLQLALNIVRSDDSLIAFDEFHQGYGATQNEMLAYFAGTPALAFVLQFALIALAILWTGGRRFGRSLPLERVSRGSKLEFISSMAELQLRARAFDLAVENIYGRVRRALVRFGGARPDMPRREIVRRIAARSGANSEKIETVMSECEKIVNGSPTNARQTLALVARLRELERALGIQMRAREIKQAGKR